MTEEDGRARTTNNDKHVGEDALSSLAKKTCRRSEERAMEDCGVGRVVARIKN